MVLDAPLEHSQAEPPRAVSAQGDAGEANDGGAAPVPNLRSHCARIEVGTGEVIKRRDDAYVAGVANVAGVRPRRAAHCAVKTYGQSSIALPWGTFIAFAQKVILGPLVGAAVGRGLAARERTPSPAAVATVTLVIYRMLSGWSSIVSSAIQGEGAVRPVTGEDIRMGSPGFLAARSAQGNGDRFSDGPERLERPPTP